MATVREIFRELDQLLLGSCTASLGMQTNFLVR